jgi:tetratricopeptide (TPR) repeat protein
MGTPMFMSPEQIAAGRAPLDHRTDIYSLGATLYQLLTLEPPFPGERREQVIAQILHKDPAPPRRINKRIPVDLETICLKALEKDPDRRYQSAGQMATDLRAYVNRFAISAKRAGPMTRTIKWCRRRPAVAALLAVVIVMSLTAGGFAYHARLSARDARLAAAQAHAAAKAARDAEGQAALDQAMVEVFSARFDKVEPWLEKAEVLGVSPGRIRIVRGWVAYERDDLELAAHELELAAQQLPDSLAVQSLLWIVCFVAGDYVRARELEPPLYQMTPMAPEDYLYGAQATQEVWPERAVEWLEHLATQRPSPFVHFMLGNVRVTELDASHSPADIDRTLAVLNGAKAQMPANVYAVGVHAEAYLIAADIYRLHGDLRHHELAIEEVRKDVQILLSEHAGESYTYSVIAELAIYEGRWEEAAAHLRAAMRLTPTEPWVNFALPRMLYRLGRYAEALAELDAMPSRMWTSPHWGRDRAFLLAELNGTENAERACRQWASNANPYARNVVGRHVPYDIYCLLGQYSDAVEASEAFLKKLGPPFHATRFSAALDEYICGRSTDEALLAGAGKHCERMEAHFVIGLKFLAAGDRATAIDQFARVEAAASYFSSTSYGSRWAYLLLERLRADPTWPPWIPLKEAPDGTTTQGNEREEQP